MPATTVTTAPTEAEIRAAIEASATHYGIGQGRGKLEEAIGEYPDDLRWLAPDPDFVGTDNAAGREAGDALWRDLRPSELDRLRTLLYEAEQRAIASCHKLIVDEYLVAIHAFAAEYPDAPRSKAGQS